MILSNNNFKTNKNVKTKSLNFAIHLIVAFTFLLQLACGNSSSDNNNDEQVVTEVEVYNADLAEDSLVLAVPLFGTEAFLVEKNGQRLKNFELNATLGVDLEILPDGRLLGMFRVNDPVTTIGGYGGIIRILIPQADGSVTTDWEFVHSTDNFIAHHDVTMLPSGNILFLSWDRVTPEEAEDLGISTSVDMFTDALIEVDPSTSEIVWEWHSIDHIIQDRNEDASNFGVVADNPNLIDYHYVAPSDNQPIDTGNVSHANGIAYDSARELIYLTVNEFGEVWVIDHSTTNEEAATNSGGQRGMGGNLVYRFGNPRAYDNNQGSVIFNNNNHGPSLIESGLPGAGNLLVFSNGNQVNASTVYELQLDPDNFNLQVNSDNEPDVAWSFSNDELFAPIAGSAIRLENSNTLIAENDYGFWEVTEGQEVVWRYNGNGVRFWRGLAYPRSVLDFLP